MARKSTPPKGVVWENTLPSTYETLVNDFYAEMTVEQMVNHFEVDTVIPANIKNIKVGSFTPNMFIEPEWVDFWRQPVVNMPQTTRNALNDPDIAEIQAAGDFYVDTEKPTLETMARVAQTQYLGIKLRQAEMASDTFVARLESLKDPVVYQKILDSDINKKLGNPLPKKMPHFKIASGENRIKSLESAMGKAHHRRGRPKNKAVFLANPDNCGVFPVSDVMRTQIDVTNGKDIDQNFDKNYKDLTNVMAVAMKIGILGIMPEQLNDQISYPPSSDVKDHLPAFYIKGQLVHLGAPMKDGSNGKAELSYLHVPFEVQIVGVPKFTLDITRAMYGVSRQAQRELQVMQDTGSTNADLMASLQETIIQADTQRHNLFNINLPKKTQARRAAFNESRDGRDRDLAALAEGKAIVPETPAQKEAARRGQPVQPRELAFEDEISRAIYEKHAILQPNGGTLAKALEVAKNEFPLDEYAANANVILIPLDPRRNDARKAFSLMIQHSGADITERAPRQKAPRPMDLAASLN